MSACFAFASGLRRSSVLNLRRHLFVVALLGLIIFSAVYTLGLSFLIPHHHLSLVVGSSISIYSQGAVPSHVGWSDSNFSTGWSIDSSTNQLPGGYGFRSNGTVGYLYATFSGSAQQGVEIEKQTSFSTADYPLLNITWRGTTNDASLSFSFAVVTPDGRWVGGPWSHFSASLGTSAFDMSLVYIGSVKEFRLRITNDYDPTASPGIQGVFLVSVTFLSRPHSITNSSYNVVSSSFTPLGNLLNVSGISPASRYSLGKASIVSAMYQGPIDVDLSVYRYLVVSVITDSPSTQARIILWQGGISFAVLVTSFDTSEWRTVIVDLKPFGVGGDQIRAVELGYQVAVASYSQAHFVVYGGLQFSALA